MSGGDGCLVVIWLLTFFLDKKSNKKVKPIRSILSYDRSLFLRIGVGRLRYSKGIKKQEVAACYQWLMKALIFRLLSLKQLVFCARRKRDAGRFPLNRKKVRKLCK
jgi:hypothetical protein